MNNDPDDDLLTVLLLLSGVGGFGVLSIGTFLAPVRDWLVDVGVLASGDGVVLAFTGGAGLDLPRLLIAIGVVLLLLLLAVTIISRRRKAVRSRV